MRIDIDRRAAVGDEKDLAFQVSASSLDVHTHSEFTRADKAIEAILQKQAEKCDPLTGGIPEFGTVLVPGEA